MKIEHDMFSIVDKNQDSYFVIKLHNIDYGWVYNFIREMPTTLMRLDDSVQKLLLGQFNRNDFVIIKFEDDSSLFWTDPDLEDVSSHYVDNEQDDLIKEKYYKKMYINDTKRGVGGIVFFKNEVDLTLVNLSRCFGVYSCLE